ncbi:MAG: gp436 family protein [Planctomycetota bacterium]|jgi:phage gp36-like protein
MSYASNTDVEERLGSTVYVQLTDDGGTGSADEDKVAEALLGSEGQINSYLGRRYAVPVDTSGHSELAAVLKSVTLDLVEYRLHCRRPPVAEEIHRKKAAAVKWLEGIACGRSVLPASSELPGNEAEGVLGEVMGPERIMTREEMEDL